MFILSNSPTHPDPGHTRLSPCLSHEIYQTMDVKDQSGPKELLCKLEQLGEGSINIITLHFHTGGRKSKLSAADAMHRARGHDSVVTDILCS